MGFLSMFFGNLNHGSSQTISVSSGSVPLPKNAVLPTDLKDFKSWHYKALRRLDGHFVGEPFSGVMSLQVDFPKFIPILIDMGLLYVGNWEQSLSVLKNDDLKNILKAYSLKQTGKKSELIFRICSGLTYEQVVAAGYGKLAYFQTDLGKDAIAKSYAILEAEELAFFSIHFKMIYDGELDRAYRSICSRNASMPVVPGMGFDWSRAASVGILQNEYYEYKNLLKISRNKANTCLAIYCRMSGESESTASALYTKMMQLSNKE